MTEAEWLTSADAEKMYFLGVEPVKSGRRRVDLFCVACSHLVCHLIDDPGARQPFEWLADHPGERHRKDTGRHARGLFHGVAQPLYEAHHRRDVGVSGAAAHVAYDFWADWYEYAFDNLGEYFTDPGAPYPNALRDDPQIYLPAVLRDIFGNPFRTPEFAPEWRTSTAVMLARQMYESREFDAMPILADALQDAGCDSDDVLAHCRGPGPHVRGCWVCDLVLGKE